MEIKKIAFACFIGGAFCCAVALLFAPVYWWFGLIAGFAGGYISYEFREVRRAVPIALRAARKGSMSAWENTLTKAQVWFSRPHPFFYPSAIVVAPLFVWGSYYIVPWGVHELGEASLFLKIFITPIFFVEVAFCFFVLAWIVLVPLFTFAFIGARAGERCYWQPFVMVGDKEVEAHIQKLEEKGYREKRLTYLNVLRWMVIGLRITIFFFVWTMWKHFAIGAWAILRFFARFIWHLFRLIHSEKRVLCAIDGTFGGAVSYIWLVSASMSFAEQAMLVIFGGLLGAAFGVANWEIVSKRILHVVPTNGT